MKVIKICNKKELPQVRSREWQSDSKREIEKGLDTKRKDNKKNQMTVETSPQVKVLLRTVLMTPPF